MSFKRNVSRSLLVCGSSLLMLNSLSSCAPEGDTATKRLDKARSLYEQGLYEDSKDEIDSINALFPDAFKERRMAHSFLDTVRQTLDEQIIQRNKLQIEEMVPKIDSLKKLFVLEKDAKYQEIGNYYPKETPASGTLNYTTLRAGVQEDGAIFLESIYIGGQKHNQLEITVRGDTTIASNVVTDEGFNHRFANLGKQYEVLRFTASNENGIARLINENSSKAITVTLKGSGKTAFSLSTPLKNAIARSYELSSAILFADSLKNDTDNAQVRIKYVQNRDEVNAIKKELDENHETMRNVKKVKE